MSVKPSMSSEDSLLSSTVVKPELEHEHLLCAVDAPGSEAVHMGNKTHSLRLQFDSSQGSSSDGGSTTLMDEGRGTLAGMRWKHMSVELRRLDKSSSVLVRPVDVLLVQAATRLLAIALQVAPAIGPDGFLPPLCQADKHHAGRLHNEEQADRGRQGEGHAQGPGPVGPSNDLPCEPAEPDGKLRALCSYTSSTTAATAAASSSTAAIPYELTQAIVQMGASMRPGGGASSPHGDDVRRRGHVLGPKVIGGSAQDIGSDR